MVIKNVSLETVCGITSRIPDNPYIEFAFAGKSNVGKSSLINGLMNRKSLARTSAQPGKHRPLIFIISMMPCILSIFRDMAMQRSVNRKRPKWGKMIENYLHSSRQLKAVFLLIDIRHEPSGNDKMMYEWICNQGYEPVIIATKLDKINRSQVQKHVKMIKEGLQVVKGTIVIPYSAQTKQGREEIYDLLDSYLI